MHLLHAFLKVMQIRFHEGIPVLLDCSRRLFPLVSRFGQLFWEHKALLRYDIERQMYRRFGVNPKSDESLALDVGSCIVRFIMIYEFERFER